MEDGVLDYPFNQYNNHHALIGKEMNFSKLIEFFNKQLAATKQSFHWHRKHIYNQLSR